MKKVIRLTENDLIRLVKRVINEQTQPKEFRLGNAKYRIQNITQLETPWSKIEFVKLLPNGMVEKKLNTGFVTSKMAKTIFSNQNTNSRPYGVSDIDLVINIKPNNQNQSNVPNDLITPFKEGISKIFKNKKVDLSNNILSVGNISIKLSGNKVIEISIPKVKTIDGQILPSGSNRLNINLENISLEKALGIIKNEIENISKYQSSKFKTTVKKEKPILTRDVPYNGTQFKP